MSEELFTTEEAAKEVGVSVSAIYAWVNRGVLSPNGKRGRSNVFRLSDVFKAESSRQRKHRRKTVA